MNKKCPKCKHTLGKTEIELLRKQKTIICRGCFTYLRIHQNSIPIMMSTLGGVLGVYGAKLGLPTEAVVSFMFFFSIAFYLFFTRFLGFYYELEEDEDLM